MQISGVICLDIVSNGMCVMERVGSAGEIHIRPADRLKTCGFEHVVRYPNAFVRHRGERGPIKGVIRAAVRQSRYVTQHLMQTDRQ